MNVPFIAYAPYIRLGLFFGLFLLFALWEVFLPRRRLHVSKLKRWTTNIGITTINTLLLRILFGAGAVGMAMAAQENGWGLLNVVALPFSAAVIFSILALDFLIYLQHVMFHAIPFFWRFHLMHHTDLDLDVTSGTRFHPVEIFLSMGIKFGAIFALGTPALSVLIFEILLNATSMFNHSNIYFPETIDRVLRLFIVTPDMHRVHHSVIIKETNANFGFNIPWWDRLFGTYRPQPEKGHHDMTIGLARFRESNKLTLFHLLLIPFLRHSSR
jgi:sterol desaturase/sphingolipid hydroxylase (fatty acid hydroxylase superfamily)